MQRTQVRSNLNAYTKINVIFSRTSPRLYIIQIVRTISKVTSQELARATAGTTRRAINELEEHLGTEACVWFEDDAMMEHRGGSHHKERQGRWKRWEVLGQEGTCEHLSLQVSRIRQDFAENSSQEVCLSDNDDACAKATSTIWL